MNVPGGLQAMPAPRTVTQDAPSWSRIRSRDLVGYVRDTVTWKQPPPKVLLCFESNPAYSLPNNQAMYDLMGKVDFKVSFSQFMDETAASSDLILPHPYFLERVDDCYTPFGSGQATYSLNTPVVKAQADSRFIPDFLLEMARSMGLSTPVDSFQDLLQARAEQLGADLKKLKQSGAPWSSEQVIDRPAPALWNQNIAAMAAAAQKSASSGLTLAVDHDLKVGTPQSGIPPYGLKALRQDELPQLDLPARMNQAMADKHGLKPGDTVFIKAPHGARCLARVEIDEGVMPGHVVTALGYGHTHWDEFNQDKGANANSLFVVRREKGSGLSTWCDSPVNIEKTALVRS